jgi:DNA-binding NtrC family response regulator
MIDNITDIVREPLSFKRSLYHLLLVDDDPALLDALSGTLRSRLVHFELDTCESGAKALDLVRSKVYDTIILDVNMPNMNGLQVLTAVKQMRSTTPVLMITAQADPPLMMKALEAGAEDFIAKPFDREEFVRAVRQSLELSRLQSVVVKLEARQRKTSEQLGVVRERLHQHALRTLKNKHR